MEEEGYGENEAAHTDGEIRMGIRIGDGGDKGERQRR